MQNVDIQSLNDAFAIPGHLSFTAGPGSLPMVEIHSAHATATVALQGGQVVTYQPHDQQPVLWVSERSIYAPGKAIRGGIPVCWPWFGPHPDDPHKPQHGFARTAMWQVLGTTLVEPDAVQLRLGLTDTAETRTLWPHAFALELGITAGPELRVELTARNPGTEAMQCTSALHSYFQVSAIEAVTIYGLEGSSYIDKVDAARRKLQQGPITIAGETDRIYLDTTNDCTIQDPGLGRRIHVAKVGSRSTVVWNPWVDKARQLADFGDEEYRQMVCIETANAGDDVITIAPGGAHTLGTTIRVEQGAGE
jgi:D-hexose-6-phosphate mutarotase